MALKEVHRKGDPAGDGSMNSPRMRLASSPAQRSQTAFLVVYDVLFIPAADHQFSSAS